MKYNIAFQCRNRQKDVLRYFAVGLRVFPQAIPLVCQQPVLISSRYGLRLLPFILVYNSFPFLFPAHLYNPDRKPFIVSANFDCFLSVRSRPSMLAGGKSSSPASLASVFFAASLFGLVANLHAEK